MKKTETEVQDILKESGLTANYLGFTYLSYMAILCLGRSEDLPVHLKELYCETAQKYHTSSYCIERDIRTAVQVIWRKREHVPAHIGDGADHKYPTNRQFLLDLISSLNVNCED